MVKNNFGKINISEICDNTFDFGQQNFEKNKNFVNEELDRRTNQLLDRIKRYCDDMELKEQGDLKIHRSFNEISENDKIQDAKKTKKLLERLKNYFKEMNLKENFNNNFQGLDQIDNNSETNDEVSGIFDEKTKNLLEFLKNRFEQEIDEKYLAVNKIEIKKNQKSKKQILKKLKLEKDKILNKADKVAAECILEATSKLDKQSNKRLIRFKKLTKKFKTRQNNSNKKVFNSSKLKSKISEAELVEDQGKFQESKTISESSSPKEFFEKKSKFSIIKSNEKLEVEESIIKPLRKKVKPHQKLEQPKLPLNQNSKLSFNSGFHQTIHPNMYTKQWLEKTKCQNSFLSKNQKFNCSNIIPFIQATSTTPSHNIMINIQQFQNMLKSKQAFFNMSPTLVHNLSLVTSNNPIQISSQLSYKHLNKKICPLLRQANAQLSNIYESDFILYSPRVPTNNIKDIIDEREKTEWDNPITDCQNSCTCYANKHNDKSLFLKLIKPSTSAILPSGLHVGRTNIKQVAEKRKSDIELFLRSLFKTADEIAHSDLVYTFFHPLLRDQQPIDLFTQKLKDRRNNNHHHDIGKIKGELKLSFVYARDTFSVMVQHARDLPKLGNSNQEPNAYVKVYLQPDYIKATKRKTKVVKRNCFPTFMEMLEYRLPLSIICGRMLQATVWNHDPLQENEFLGGVEIDLRQFNLNVEVSNWYPLRNVTKN